jgi:hypothetical protein
MIRLRQGSGAAGPFIAALAAIGLAAFGVVKGTWAVGGSDSSCYGLMAQAFAAGNLQPSSSIAIDAPWPEAQRTLAPGGFIPSPVRPDAASPICAPGMAVLMAPLAAVFGRDAIFWLVPLSGALLVWSAFLIARRLAGGTAGAVAAVLTATSPIVLFQVVQPMNDVLAAALWLSAFAFVIDRPTLVIDRPKGLSPQVAGGTQDAGGTKPLSVSRGEVDKSTRGDDKSTRGDKPLGLSIAGFLAGMAILVRPNLAPLVFVIALTPFLLKWPQPARAVVVMSVAALPGIVVMLWLNQQLYGSVFASGYGDAAQLFSVGHLNRNLSNFGRAIIDTQYGVPLLGLLAPMVFGDDKRRMAIVLLLAAVVVVLIYLLYQPYPEWWYLRFLIPALVLLLTTTSAASVAVASRARIGGVIPLVAVLLALAGTRTAGERHAFELQRLEGRYRDAAAMVTERLPDHAVLITVWQSGSVRFHADREAVLWDSLDPASLDRAVGWLQDRGRQPYFLFERREEAEFRNRFRGHSTYGALDWPPRIDVNRQVRIYDPADRARFLAGEKYPTDNQPRRK